MPVWLACLLLVLDGAAFCVLRRRLRGKTAARTVVSIVCILLAAALAVYLALTAILLNGAYHN